jgi:RNA polymerase sigma-70 factor (ECF subfamily)
MDEAERELVERARDGDRGAFREIVEAHQGRLYSLALGLLRDRQDAEDAVQEAFLRAYRGLKGFRGGSQLGSWLYRIAVNVCLESRRRRRPLALGAPIESAEDPRLVEDRPEADPERRASSAGLRQAIDAAILRLSPLERAAFALRHDGGLPLLEIARVLGRAEGTIKAVLFRALRKLQRELRPWRAGEAGR